MFTVNYMNIHMCVFLCRCVGVYAVCSLIIFVCGENTTTVPCKCPMNGREGIRSQGYGSVIPLVIYKYFCSEVNLTTSHFEERFIFISLVFQIYMYVLIYKSVLLYLSVLS